MKRALLVIDVQNEYFTGKLPVTYPDNSMQNILKAMDAANEYGIQIAVIRHTNSQENAKTFKKESAGWELHPEISARKFDCLIEKNLPGSFTGTNLEFWLRNRRIDTVVIAGYMTQMCCDTTSRQAVHRGYSVEFLSDATGTLNVSNYAGTVTAENLHNAVLVTQAMRFSKVLNTDEWIKSLAE